MSSAVRLLFKSIEEGDLKKLEARSNITPSGGGARDLRLPHRPLEKAITKMFPKVVQESRRRDQERKLIDVRKATLVYADANGQDQEMEITYEPPTSARPSEGRITRIHEIPALAVQNLPLHAGGRAVVLFTEHSDGKLRARYVSHADIANPPAGSGRWHPLARDTILDALRAIPEGKSACGWIDFTTGDWHVHE